MNFSFLKNKYIFVDLDGTLCEYRYYGRVSGKTSDKNSPIVAGHTLSELLFDTYDAVRPLKTMQNILSQVDPNKLYVLGACITFNEVKSKEVWLKKHYPFIKPENYIFVADLDIKNEVLKLYSKKLGIKYKDMVFIDDKHASIRKAEEDGIPSYHISSFIE